MCVSAAVHPWQASLVIQKSVWFLKAISLIVKPVLGMFVLICTSHADFQYGYEIPKC